MEIFLSVLWAWSILKTDNIKMLHNVQYSRLQTYLIYHFKSGLSSCLKKLSVSFISCYIRIFIMYIEDNLVLQLSLAAKHWTEPKSNIHPNISWPADTVLLLQRALRRVTRPSPTDGPISAPPSPTGLSPSTSAHSSDAIDRLCFYQSTWQYTRSIYSLNNIF